MDNATRLSALAEAAGVDVTLSIGEGQQHVYPFPGRQLRSCRWRTRPHRRLVPVLSPGYQHKT